ncbi:MAG: glycerol-3-phosphate acyltransferase [Bacillota bacterium]|nr:glycerol-3-phosphate acyltransferase [Bacillota bacterium]
MDSRAVIMTFIGFLSGSVMYSYLLPKHLKKVDPREKAYDKNPGGSNAIRAGGTVLGLICILLDIAKAFIPVFLTINYFNVSGFNLIPVTAAPVIGHAFSPFLRFKGGKAVASTYGVLLALYPQSTAALTLAIIMLFYKIVLVVKPDSCASIASFLTINTVLLLAGTAIYIKLIVLLISLVVISRQLIHPDEGGFGVSLLNRFFRVSFTRHKNNLNI